MSGEEGKNGQERLLRATGLAIARAKRRGSAEVSADDLLAGLLHASARFGIVALGPWTIDLERFDDPPPEGAEAGGSKAAYTPEAAALFDRAAAVARRDGAGRVGVVHMLVAFAGVEDGLMGRLREAYGIDGAGWRAALARWHPPHEGGPEQGGAPARRLQAAAVQELLSPDEAADFLGVHTQTVRGYIRSGKLAAHRVAGERALRIRRQDLLALLEPYDPD